MTQLPILLMAKELKRIFHPYERWECYPAGFFDEKPTSEIGKDEAETAYRDFLADDDKFFEAGLKVVSEWKYSCEHNLSNECMNRIAWIGQASACYAIGLPSKYRTGFNLLNDEQKNKANSIALKVLNTWLLMNGYNEITEDEAESKTVANKY